MVRRLHIATNRSLHRNWSSCVSLRNYDVVHNLQVMGKYLFGDNPSRWNGNIFVAIVTRGVLVATTHNPLGREKLT